GILENFLASPFPQMGYVKVTKPGVMESFNNREYISLYPNNNPSSFNNLRNLYAEQKSEPEKKEPVERIISDAITDLLYKLLLCQLQSLDMFSGKKPNVENVINRSGLPSFYKLWLTESIDLLIENKYLEKHEERYSVNNEIDLKNVWHEWEKGKQGWNMEYSNGPRITLVEKCLKALPDILRKKVLATDILFPNSSMELVEGIYKNNPIADYYNEIVTDGVISIVQQRISENPKAMIRILEIGAGTGGTSVMLFNKLQSYQKYMNEYCYTDISKAFLMYAEEKYREIAPYLRPHIFNVELPLSDQKIEAGTYDIVLAANVLHATKNIRKTLRNAKAAIKKQGILFLTELSNRSLFSHLTFGLLEGWWAAEDRSLRIPGGPGLYPDTWRKVLEEEGFCDVFFPAEESHKSGQQIIIAASNGVVRQQRNVVEKSDSISLQTSERNSGIKHNVKELTFPDKYESNIELLKEKAVNYMKQVISKTLKIPVRKIYADEQLGKYGLDSILIVQLTNILSKNFRNINSTMFFEFQTINSIIDHLLNTQKQNVVKLFAIENQILKVKDDFKKEEIDSDIFPNQLKRRRYRSLPRTETNQNKIQDIAVIGIAGKYPGAKNINEYWENLMTGRNCITEIPADRWDWQEYYDEEKGKKGKIYSKWGGFIEDIDKFDPLFFRISPKEAMVMDPQERLFLEMAYACIQDAGYQPKEICESRKVGVFAGVMNNDYSTSPAYWSIANRISYLFDFYGPSMAVDTACSSSLTAIHLALESLYSGTSECAIAGGVNLINSPRHYIELSGLNMLSAGDTCKSFGANADGFIDGEGVGAILLKPLNKAIGDKDHIYGVIKGSMINAGGKTNGYTVPSPKAQSELIAEAYRRSNVNPRMISYIEAHGTGTVLGDPIEIEGLVKAFSKYTQLTQYCYIGSAKSNIGHCESAAGLAAVTKVLLQLKHKKIVPSLHSKIVNPNINFENSPFIVNQELREWERLKINEQGEEKEYPRTAGISSFGFGGANAHIVIEEYIPEQNTVSNSIIINSKNPAILVLSARSREQVKEQANNLLAYLEENKNKDPDLGNIIYTLQVGREAMEERLGLIVSSPDEVRDKLKGYVEGVENIEDLYEGHVNKNKEALEVFKGDDDLQNAVHTWIEKRKYGKLAGLWVKGLELDWN
ncbi:MAG: methyltransferase, partial [Spirochaetales bacterium]|nr:methyltransferase [Spirochaetales bacterium]